MELLFRVCMHLILIGDGMYVENIIEKYFTYFCFRKFIKTIYINFIF